MTKFHIREDGNPGPCTAALGKCPLGAGAEEHFQTKTDAIRYYETKRILDDIPRASSKKKATKTKTTFAKIAMEQALKERVVISGYSDDIVCIEGIQNDEFDAWNNESNELHLSNGEVVQLFFQNDGTWRFGKIPVDTQKFAAPEDEDPNVERPRDKYNLSTYSQRLVLPEGVSVISHVGVKGDTRKESEARPVNKTEETLNQ
jgi:hypothetical protein